MIKLLNGFLPQPAFVQIDKKGPKENCILVELILIKTETKTKI